MADISSKGGSSNGSGKGVGSGRSTSNSGGKFSRRNIGNNTTKPAKRTSNKRLSSGLQGSFGGNNNGQKKSMLEENFDENSRGQSQQNEQEQQRQQGKSGKKSGSGNKLGIGKSKSTGNGSNTYQGVNPYRNAKKAVNKAGDAVRKTGKGVKNTGKAMKLAGKTIKATTAVAGTAMKYGGKGAKYAGRGGRKAGTAGMKAGAALSATGVGAIAGVPLAIASGVLTGASVGAEVGGTAAEKSAPFVKKGGKIAGNAVEKAGNAVQKAGQKVQETGENIQSATEDSSSGFGGVVKKGAKLMLKVIKYLIMLLILLITLIVILGPVVIVIAVVVAAVVSFINFFAHMIDFKALRQAAELMKQVEDARFNKSIIDMEDSEYNDYVKTIKMVLNGQMLKLDESAYTGDELEIAMEYNDKVDAINANKVEGGQVVRITEEYMKAERESILKAPEEKSKFVKFWLRLLGLASEEDLMPRLLCYDAMDIRKKISEGKSEEDAKKESRYEGISNIKDFNGNGPSWLSGYPDERFEVVRIDGVFYNGTPTDGSKDAIPYEIPKTAVYNVIRPYVLKWNLLYLFDRIFMVDKNNTTKVFDGYDDDGNIIWEEVFVKYDEETGEPIEPSSADKDSAKYSPVVNLLAEWTPNFEVYRYDIKNVVQQTMLGTEAGAVGDYEDWANMVDSFAKAGRQLIPGGIYQNWLDGHSEDATKRLDSLDELCNDYDLWREYVARYITEAKNGERDISKLYKEDFDFTSPDNFYKNTTNFYTPKSKIPQIMSWNHMTDIKEFEEAFVWVIRPLEFIEGYGFRGYSDLGSTQKKGHIIATTTPVFVLQHADLWNRTIDREVTHMERDKEHIDISDDESYDIIEQYLKIDTTVTSKADEILNTNIFSTYRVDEGTIKNVLETIEYNDKIFGSARYEVAKTFKIFIADLISPNIITGNLYDLDTIMGKDDSIVPDPSVGIDDITPEISAQIDDITDQYDNVDSNIMKAIYIKEKRMGHKLVSGSLLDAEAIEKLQKYCEDLDKNLQTFNDIGLAVMAFYKGTAQVQSQGYTSFSDVPKDSDGYAYAASVLRYYLALCENETYELEFDDNGQAKYDAKYRTDIYILDGDVDSIKLFEYNPTVDSHEWDGTDPEGKFEPEDEDPSGEDPSGEDPSGEDPSGEDPSGEDPSGEDPSTVTGKIIDWNWSKVRSSFTFDGTGKVFNVIMTSGKKIAVKVKSADSYHIDVVPNTSADTSKILGSRTWNRTGILVETKKDGVTYYIVAGRHNQPHGMGYGKSYVSQGESTHKVGYTVKEDNSYPPNTKNMSLAEVKAMGRKGDEYNGWEGHFCIHFWGSKTHSGNPSEGSLGKYKPAFKQAANYGKSLASKNSGLKVELTQSY